MGVAIYCRVSTDAQELGQQIESCKRFAEFKKLEVGEVFAEIGSGKTFRRPKLQEMLGKLRQGLFQGVVAFRFDRLGRNSREVCLFFDEFEGRGVQIYSVHENLDTTTPIGRAMREILVTLAQLERENISEATRHRLAALKAVGKKLGRRERELDVAKAAELRAGGASWSKIAQAVHAPASTIRLRLQQKGGEKPAVIAKGQPIPATDAVSCKPLV
ncbi:MAG: recombinase family protein [Candidatus Micrarchaeota archaeon]